MSNPLSRDICIRKMFLYSTDKPHTVRVGNIRLIVVSINFIQVVM